MENTSELTESEANKVLELLSLIKNVDCFEYEGIIFIGEKVQTVKEFVKKKPTDKFFIWLQKNRKQFQQ